MKYRVDFTRRGPAIEEEPDGLDGLALDRGVEQGVAKGSLLLARQALAHHGVEFSQPGCRGEALQHSPGALDAQVAAAESIQTMHDRKRLRSDHGGRETRVAGVAGRGFGDRVNLKPKGWGK